MQGAQSIRKHYDRKEETRGEKKGLRKRAPTCYSVVCFFFRPVFLGGIMRPVGKGCGALCCDVGSHKVAVCALYLRLLRDGSPGRRDAEEGGKRVVPRS